MIAYQNEKCDNVRQILDFYLNSPALDAAFSEIETHLENCLSCRREWQRRKNIRDKIKTAVMRQTAPPQLLDSIRRQIRESK